jgi:hypothetical protein
MNLLLTCDALAETGRLLSACSFRWIVVTENTVRWFIVREKYCWMTADSADMLKRTRRILIHVILICKHP